MTYIETQARPANDHAWLMAGVRKSTGRGGRREPTVSDDMVIVPLNGARKAIVDREDFDRMTEAGITDQWCLAGDGKGNAYVVISRPWSHTGSTLTVARIIMEAGRGEVVRYRDGDTVNLRRSNLVLAGGSGLNSALGIEPTATNVRR